MTKSTLIAGFGRPAYYTDDKGLILQGDTTLTKKRFHEEMETWTEVF